MKRWEYRTLNANWEFGHLGEPDHAHNGVDW